MTDRDRPTPRQAAARAANGRRHSTGPKTEEGKKVSSRNALKHGGYAKSTPVIPRGPLAEDPVAHEQFAEGIVAALSPQTPLEEELAAKIASILWRSRRPGEYEALLFSWPPVLSRQVRQADAMMPRLVTTARVLRNPNKRHSDTDLLVAAIHVAHQVPDRDIDDDWPQPRPSDQEGWYRLIDETLKAAGLSRAAAAAYCDQLHERWSEDREEHVLLDRSARVKELLDRGDLHKVARVETHLGRELSRLISLYRVAQSYREPNPGEA